MKKLFLYFCVIFLAACYVTALEESSDVDTNVKFYLYTQQNPETPQLLSTYDENSVKKSNFNISLPTKIIIHGWANSFKTIPNEALREAYLSKANYNIITVDWNEYAKLNYILARGKVPQVGKSVAQFVDFLNANLNINFESLVVIGHSLGAHIAGYCGKSVTRGKLAAIVGLDPASPFFSAINPKHRLAETDAKFVLTIQTNGILKGYLKPIGSAAFHPNWGRIQPGCGKDLKGRCSHARCVDLYAEAIKGYSYDPIYTCKNYAEILFKKGCSQVNTSVQIGDPLEIKQKAGIYYFETESKAPFGHL